MLKANDVFLFVIVTRPQQQVVTGTSYIAKDAGITKMSWHAAKFLSYTHAKQFAKENCIALNGSTYISLKSIADLQFVN